MGNYYVTHPNVDFSAVVDAPTPEKARTVYLDYMERTGKLNRSRRQAIRENLIAERVSDGDELDADAHLSYYYGGSRAEVTLEPPEMEVETEPRTEAGYEEEPSVEYVEEPEEEERGDMSPIGRIATQGY